MKAIYITILLFIVSGTSFAKEHRLQQLHYWVLFSGGDARPMQLIVDKFNAQHPNINVKMKVIRWSRYYDRLTDSIKNNKTPNIAIVHASLLHRYIESKQLTNLDSYGIQWQEFSPTLLQYMQYKKSHYAVPLDTHPQLLYFNKKYLRQANLLDKNQEPIIEAGVDGFINFLTTLKKKLPEDIRPLATANLNVYPFWIWYSLYMQHKDAHYITDNKASFNNKAGKDALEVLKKLRNTHVWDENIHDEKGYNLFKFNKAATMITGSWATWNFQQNKQLDFGVTLFPTLFAKDANFGDSHTLVAFKKSDPEEVASAIEFIKWLSKNSYLWSLSGQIPSNKTVTSSRRFLELPNRRMYLKAANSVAFYPHHPKLKECNDFMIRTMSHFLKSNDSVEDTLNRAEIEINKILGS